MNIGKLTINSLKGESLYIEVKTSKKFRVRIFLCTQLLKLVRLIAPVKVEIVEDKP